MHLLRLMTAVIVLPAIMLAAANITSCGCRSATSSLRPQPARLPDEPWRQGEPRRREGVRIGAVFGRAVYVPMLPESESERIDLLHRRLFGPVWTRFAEEHAELLKPTEQEIAAHIAFQRGQPLLAVLPLPPEHQAVDGEALRQGKRPSPERHIAEWWLARWKMWRLIYARYGGGTLIYQQLGVEPLDAMHRFLLERERAGDLTPAPEHREALYRYFNARHIEVSPEHADKTFLDPPWARPAPSVELLLRIRDAARVCRGLRPLSTMPLPPFS